MSQQRLRTYVPPRNGSQPTAKSVVTSRPLAASVKRKVFTLPSFTASRDASPMGKAQRTSTVAAAPANERKEDARFMQQPATPVLPTFVPPVTAPLVVPPPTSPPTLPPHSLPSPPPPSLPPQSQPPSPVKLAGDKDDDDDDDDEFVDDDTDMIPVHTDEPVSLAPPPPPSPPSQPPSSNEVEVTSDNDTSDAEEEADDTEVAVVGGGVGQRPHTPQVAEPPFVPQRPRTPPEEPLFVEQRHHIPQSEPFDEIAIDQRLHASRGSSVHLPQPTMQSVLPRYDLQSFANHRRFVHTFNLVAPYLLVAISALLLGIAVAHIGIV